MDNSLRFIGTVALLAWLAPTAAESQDSNFSPPRTPWGDPDFRGHFVAGTSAPMENPIGDEWKLTAEEFRRYPTAKFFPDHNPAPGMKSMTRTMIIDPPNGQIPLQEWAIEKRQEIMANQDNLELLDPRVKCLPAALPRGNLPVGYNSYQFMQVPGAVIILYEWNHHTRYIPLDDSSHVSSDIQLGMGDSRGHWEGNTLVVDVTNFTDNTWVTGHGAAPEGAPATSLNTGHGVFHSADLRVVERYSLVDENTIHYEATISDPQVFTQPWTISYDAFNRAPEGHILYEYACHEGNARNLKLMTGIDVEH
jgi:hypothetical protein